MRHVKNRVFEGFKSHALQQDNLIPKWMYPQCCGLKVFVFWTKMT